MSALVDRLGAKAVFARARFDATRAAAVAPLDLATRRAWLPRFRSLRPSSGPRRCSGDIDAVRFTTLIERARTAGADGLRLAPWRSFFVTGLAPRAAASFVGASAKLGFVVQSTDLRLRVVACPGAPACLHAFRPLRDDAARWASLLPAGDTVILHLSGCAKGCARPLATAATLIATENGYDLVVDGRAAGLPVRHGLSNAAIDAFLAGEGAKLFEGERPGP